MVVEWLNVSGGADASPDWIHMHVELIRQRVRVGRRVGPGRRARTRSRLPPLGDPMRYESLTHPGDSYSYDMFSQAGQAVRDDAATVLGGLRPSG